MADQLLGYHGNGIGTTTSFLALAVARLGHQVDILYFGPPRKRAVPEWDRLYELGGVSIRLVPWGSDAVEPPHFARLRAVEHVLRDEPPDIVIAQDLGAPLYSAIQLRRLGLAFEATSFVVLCHGTRQWITDATRKVRVLPGALAVSVLERAAIEHADIVVSPSEYMLDWMRGNDWTLPERTFVIPHPTRSAATGETPPQPVATGATAERVVFFGRLEERKGLRPFATAVNALEPELLARIELEFLGRATAAWPPERVAGLLTAGARAALRGLRFEMSLDQHEALARLARPGTLVVMPSLEDNSPNTVYECLERGVPFLVSNVGGAQELVAAKDRERVLFDPTPSGIAAALRGALGEALRPVAPAHEPLESLERWSEIIAAETERVARPHETPAVDVVVVHNGSEDALARCLAGLANQTYSQWRLTVVIAGPKLSPPRGLDRRARLVRSDKASVEAARTAALADLDTEWVVFLDETDIPDPELLATLVTAQGASQSDAVTCGVHVTRADGGRTVHLYPGQPRGLGVIGNGYGNTALIRRSLLEDLESLWPPEGDPDWPLLARLDLAGANIVSVPVPLVTRSQPPGTIERHPRDALLVIEYVERSLPVAVASAARLVGGLADEALRHGSPPSESLVRRTARLVREQGPSELGRRALRRLRRAP